MSYQTFALIAYLLLESQDIFRNPFSLVGSIGLEPTTPTMSRWCSNQLSYEPKEKAIIRSFSGFAKPLA